MPNPNHINDNGTWRNATNLYAKNNGSWVEADEGWKNVNGTWTKFYDKWVEATTTTTTTTTTTQSPNACASTVHAWGFAAPNTAINGSWAITNPLQYHDARPVYTKGSLKQYYSIANSRWEIGSTLGGTPDCYASTSSSTCPYGDWTCSGTIDGTPEPTTIAFSAITSSVAEGDSGTTTHSVTVNRSGNMDGTATVAYATSDNGATAGSDYTATSGTLTFVANVTSQTISISITGDTTVETNEVFVITLSSPTQTVGTASLGTSEHSVTITNDDTATTTTTTTQSPNACASTVHAWGFAAPNTAINGSWAITSPVQYNDARPIYTKGSLKLYYSIANSRWEIGSTAGGTPDCNASTSSSVCPYGDWTCSGTIDGTPEPTEIDFNSSTSSVTEGDSGTTTHSVTVSRSGNMDGTATVDYATGAYASSYPATAGVDYTAASGTLTFSANVTSQTISISITGDTTVENNEEFMITLSNPTQTVGTASIGSTVGGSHIATITNDDVATTTTAAPTTTTALPTTTTGGFPTTTTSGGGGGGWNTTEMPTTTSSGGGSCSACADGMWTVYGYYSSESECASFECEGP